MQVTFFDINLTMRQSYIKLCGAENVCWGKYSDGSLVNPYQISEYYYQSSKAESKEVSKTFT